ncbi:hypothetical protein [Streptomyces geysiriensis]|uniref:hypothetical protein n=1 Tax=Streptomyces geysiriensis TaxID=68207 RepID=UPI002176C03D|nr:hypothetical protein [Streptomyces geysiriensis]
MHRPAAFAALLGLTRAASAIGDFWVQNDFRARVKGASDDAPVTYEDPATKEKTTHGTADGRKACLHHCVTYTATQAIVAGFGAARWASGSTPARPRPHSPCPSARTTSRTAGSRATGTFGNCIRCTVGCSCAALNCGAYRLTT